MTLKDLCPYFQVNIFRLTWYVLTIRPLPAGLLPFEVFDEGDNPRTSVRNDDELKSAADNGANDDEVPDCVSVAEFEVAMIQMIQIAILLQTQKSLVSKQVKMST